MLPWTGKKGGCFFRLWVLWVFGIVIVVCSFIIRSCIKTFARELLPS